MSHEQLAIRVYELAIKLWYRLMPDTCGSHPGPAGPPSDGPWDMAAGNLAGAIRALEEIVPHTLPPQLPDPIRVLHDLFEIGNLDDHFYHIKESEGGWDGPRMVAWAKVCADAAKLLAIYKEPPCNESSPTSPGPSPS